MQDSAGYAGLQVASRGSRRRGFTLLEIIVVLIVLALMATLVAPTMGRLPATEGGTMAAVAAQGRTVALRRAEALELRVDSSGTWLLESVRQRDTIAHGTVPGVTEAFGLGISALGLCTISGGSAELRASWDALRCSPARSGSTIGSEPVSRAGDLLR